MNKLLRMTDADVIASMDAVFGPMTEAREHEHMIDATRRELNQKLRQARKYGFPEYETEIIRLLDRLHRMRRNDRII